MFVERSVSPGDDRDRKLFSRDCSFYVFYRCTSLTIHLSIIGISCNKTPHTTQSLYPHIYVSRERIVFCRFSFASSLHSFCQDYLLTFDRHVPFTLNLTHRLNEPAPLCPRESCCCANLFELNPGAAAESPPAPWQASPPGLPCSRQPETKDQLATTWQGAGDH